MADPFKVPPDKNGPPSNPFVPPPNLAAMLPPPPPQGTPPGAGFQAYASDPLNAMKVQSSMTSPSDKLQPNTNVMASATPPMITPKPSPLLPPSMQDDMKANPGAYQNKIAKGKVGNILNMIAATSLGAAGGMKGNPGLGANYAMDVFNHDQGVGDANQKTYNSRIVQPQKDALAMADTQAQIDQRKAMGEKSDAQADSYKPVSLSPEQAVAIGHPELAGQEMPSKLYATMLSGKQKTDSAGKIASDKNQTAKDISDARNKRIAEINDAANKTKLLLQDKRDATSAGNTNARIAAKGTPGANGSKVPADVTKRAALSSNVLENADAVEEIVRRRPDIVGAAGGRYSNVQQMIGSDDPDIQALGVRMHNIALASNGAHGLRSAEAIAQTENELFNHYKAGPNAIHGGLNAIRGSVQTFLDDEKNYQTSGNRTGNPLKPPTVNAGPQVGTIESGHKFTGGDPADPKNWVVVKGGK